MNPKFYYYIFIGSIAVNAANLADLTANVQITAHTDAGHEAIRNSFKSSPEAKIQIISDEDSIPTGVEVRHVKISPGKKVVISVDPCDSSGPSEDLAVIPQNIEPAVTPSELPAGEQELADQIDKNKSIYDDMNAADLETNIKKVIEFFDLLRQAGSGRISRKITAPQLTFIGESDEFKRQLIEKLTGINLENVNADTSGTSNTATAKTTAATATTNTANSNSAYSMPVRFKLIKNPEYATTPLVKVNDKEETGNLFTVLNAMGSDKLVEVEIQSATVSSMIFVDLPEGLPLELKRKHLEHAWNLTVAIGSTGSPFEEWETLKLTRSLDQEMRRIFTFAISKKSTDRLKPVALGLQQSVPAMTRNKMFYSGIEETAAVCEIARCGEAQLIVGLQRKFLKIWSLLRPAAVKIIQGELDGFEARIRGHEEFQLKTVEEKWTELIGQIGSVLGEQLMFLTEDRDRQPCSGASVLDTIKESIFTGGKQSDNAPVSFREVFANYQRDISRILPIPAGIDEIAIRSKIEELRNSGPKNKTISELENLLFTPQMESLKTVKSDFLGKIETAWRAAVQNALENKFALEPYDALKSHVTGASETAFQDQLKEIAGVNREIDAADATSKWVYNFFNSKTNVNIWIELMKIDTPADALVTFYRNATEGFTNICNIQAALQVRLVIDKLLTNRTLQSILKGVEGGNKTELTAMSDAAKEKIQKTKELIAKLKEAIAKASEA